MPDYCTVQQSGILFLMSIRQTAEAFLLLLIVLPVIDLDVVVVVRRDQDVAEAEQIACPGLDRVGDGEDGAEVLAVEHRPVVRDDAGVAVVERGHDAQQDRKSVV